MKTQKYNIISTFSDILKAQLTEFKGYTSKERSRILRRRSKEFRDRWKKLYPKWFLHQLRKGRGTFMQAEIANRLCFSGLSKDRVWSGRKYTVPFKTEGV